MNQNKYETALEVFEEYVDSDSGPSDFDDFLKEKIKPKDVLFEKFEKWHPIASDLTIETEFKEFKKIFGPELNGIRGLDLLVEKLYVCPDKVRTYSKAGIRDIVEEIKERLEKC